MQPQIAELIDTLLEHGRNEQIINRIIDLLIVERLRELAKVKEANCVYC